MKPQIQQLLAEIVKTLFGAGAEIAVDIPESSQHGDYTTNIAMLLAGRLKAPPMKIGQEIIDAIKKHQNESGHEWLERVEVVPPGFINLWLSKHYFGSQIAEVLEKKEQYGSKLKTVHGSQFTVHSRKKLEEKKEPVITGKTKSPQLPKLPQSPQSFSGSAGKEEKKPALASFGNPQTIMVEFAHPNTHKAFHIGHLRNITTGEATVRLLESQGYRVIRANYQGDVGMHIAKALYALLELSPFKEEVASVSGIKTRVEFLGKAYAAGSKVFEENEKEKEKIKDFNYLVYAAAERLAVERGLYKPSTDYLAFVEGDKSVVDRVYELWKETRQWSLDYFETIYKRVGSHYDRLYFESECLTGVDLAKEAVKQRVLKESDGAIIFDGKSYGIDTRVFVNSLGLPTYEGKELALSRMESTEFGKLERIIHVVGPEQASFFKVSFKVEELLGYVKPDIQYHLIYGWVNLKHGKMSSRSGVVVLGEWLLDEAKKAVFAIFDSSSPQSPQSPLSPQSLEEIAEAAAIAAVKYAFLRVGTNQEIAFDLKESISFDGDSGPYLLYTYARCKSVLRKAKNAKFDQLVKLDQFDFNPEERNLARRISQFPEVVAVAATRFAPNTLCTYLFHLAQEFNLLYAKHSILGVKLEGNVPMNLENKKGQYYYHTQARFRLALTTAVAQVLHNGLYLLGIETVERM